MRNISASETLRQKIQKQNLKLHCSRPMSRDKGGVDKSNPVVFFQLFNDSLNDLVSEECIRLETQIIPEFQLLIFVKLN